jgi:hypothetical protein
MLCQALNSKGQPCEVYALKGEDRCLFHSTSEKAKALREKAHHPGGFISRQELLRTLTKDFRELASRTDEESRRQRLRLVPLLHELINETQQLAKLKKLAKEKGLL